MHVQWVTYTPEATFQTVCNAERYAATILEQGGPEALQQWRALEREMAPLQQGAATFPAAALRSDLGDPPGSSSNDRLLSNILLARAHKQPMQNPCCQFLFKWILNLCML